MLGTVIGGRYRLNAPLGAGGFGEVWVAERLDVGDRVAIKILTEEASANKTAVERFFREMATPGEIGHPALTKVFDTGIWERRPFIVMEYLEGRSLRAVFADPYTSVARRIQLLEGVLDPLTAAHQRGFVHRDLKPENIFETKAGNVKLLDFGLTRRVTEDSNLTATGTALGTAYYMSPEQARSAKTAGPAADVWAIGAMLQEAMTGRRPFEGETAADVIVGVCTKPPPKLAPSETISAQMIELVEWCLEKDPRARPADASVLRSALAAARSGQSARSVLGATMVADASTARGIEDANAANAASAVTPPSAPPDAVRSRSRWYLWALPLAFVLSAGLAWLAASMLAKKPPQPASVASAPTVTEESPTPEGATLPSSAMVRVESSIEDAMLYVDGLERGPLRASEELTLGPGMHRIEARRRDRILAGETLELAAGDSRELTLVAARARSTMSSPVTSDVHVARDPVAPATSAARPAESTPAPAAPLAGVTPTPTAPAAPIAAAPPAPGPMTRLATRVETSSPFVAPMTTVAAPVVPAPAQPAPALPPGVRPAPTAPGLGAPRVAVAPAPVPVAPGFGAHGAPPSDHEMRAALDQIQAQVRACDPTYRGRVNLSVSFRPDGGVHAARVSARSREERCMRAAIERSARVRAFSGRAARVRHSWTL